MKRMARCAALVLLLVVCSAAAGAAGEFPAGLRFIEKLPVIMRGECVEEGIKVLRWLPCEVRTNDAGRVIYFIFYHEGSVIGVEELPVGRSIMRLGAATPQK